jgi:cell division protease FtsH
VKSSLAAAGDDDGDDKQQVLKPEAGRKPGFGEGHTTPA